MRPLLIIICAACLSACAPPPETIDDLTLPELIHQTPLPDYPKPIATPNFKIDLEILVAEDGTVHYVNILNPSNDASWDTAAIAAIKQWQYQPARYKGQPIRLWLRQTAIVQFSTPHVLNLAEIVLPTQPEADSVYTLLKEGCPFCDAAKKYSISKSGQKEGVLGEVNIHAYPDRIQKVLERLDEGSFSEPIQYGSGFVIFFRIKTAELKVSSE